jgi:hypothetical protein
MRTKLNIYVMMKAKRKLSTTNSLPFLFIAETVDPFFSRAASCCTITTKSYAIM